MVVIAELYLLTTPTALELQTDPEEAARVNPAMPLLSEI